MDSNENLKLPQKLKGAKLLNNKKQEKVA